MSDAVKGLEPQIVWKYFAQIARIPRCSKNEEAMTQFVVGTAKNLGLEAETDRFGNVVVRKPASKGRERVPGIVLQGHLDMVCEKNRDKKHDFSRDPIQLVRKDNILSADGTTLGADNGIAVATNLAIMEDSSLEHGPLEFLFTVDEETGLTGASNLGKKFLRHRTLINLDSEEEGALYVGCAGGRDTVGTWKVAVEPAPSDSADVIVRVLGLRGGHSGLDISAGRGNAIKLLNRILLSFDKLGARISTIEAGSKRNAIPREAEAQVSIPKGQMKAAQNCVAELEKVFKAELGKSDPQVRCSFETVKAGKGVVVKPRLQKKILRVIAALPHGVIKMSADIPGLVETSTNVAVVKLEGNSLRIETSQRSSVATEISEICQSVEALFRLAGARVAQPDGYPGWKPDMDSKILKTAISTFKSLYRKEPEVKAIHAGLECGIIGEKYPGIDMVSMGPTLEAVHSPEEKIYIDSVGRFWHYLLAILGNMK